MFGTLTLRASALAASRVSAIVSPVPVTTIG